MRVGDACLGAALAVALATTSCDSSKSELETVKSDLASATADRDGLKSKLEAANKENTALAAKVAELTAKVDATKPTTAKLAKHRRGGGAAKAVTHAPSRKSKA